MNTDLYAEEALIEASRLQREALRIDLDAIEAVWYTDHLDQPQESSDDRTD